MDARSRYLGACLDSYRRQGELLKAFYGQLDVATAQSIARAIAPPSNIQSVIYSPSTLEFWVANADAKTRAAERPYRHFSLPQLLGLSPYAGRLPPKRVLMINAYFDNVIIRECSLALWEMSRQPHLVMLPTGHFSAILYLPYARRLTYRHFRRCFSENSPHG